MITPQRREVVAGLAAVAGLGACATNLRRSSTSKPNVVLIIADDLRADAIAKRDKLGIKTPHIDALVAEGHSFDDAFVTTSICPTSRASIMTGQFASNHKYWNWSEITQAQLDRGLYGLMKSAGYQTAYIGKWGLGTESRENFFNIWYGFDNFKLYYDEEYGGKHLTEFIGAKAVNAINQLKDAPFFLTFATLAAHTQHREPYWDADHVYDESYKELFYPTAPSATTEAFDRLPEFLKTSEGRERWRQRFGNPETASETLRDYYRLVNGLDAQVGRIVSALKERNLYDDTLIVFTSDNGMLLGEHGLSGKWWMFEESIRVPLVIKMPSGSRREPIPQVALNIDVMPTILEACSLQIPQTVDGKSLLASGPQRTQFFYEHLFDHPRIIKSEGIWSPSYKYINYGVGGSTYEMLFDLRIDPYELNNLALLPGSQVILSEYRERFKSEKARVQRAHTDEAAE